jgi:hypothetical protein
MTWSSARSKKPAASRVVKEPTSLNYYCFKENEYFILTLLDSNNEVRDLVRLYSQQHRPIRPETVQNFLDRAESFGLLVKERASIYERLLRQQLPVPVAKLTSALRFNLTLPDTDGFTQRIYHRIAFMFCKPMVMLWVALAPTPTENTRLDEDGPAKGPRLDGPGEEDS